MTAFAASSFTIAHQQRISVANTPSALEHNEKVRKSTRTKVFSLKAKERKRQFCFFRNVGDLLCIKKVGEVTFIIKVGEGIFSACSLLICS